MTHFSTSAIVLQRRSYADFDLIVTVISRDYGKCTLIAKSAKKSIKRFSGGLEPFSQLQLVYRQGRSKDLFLLEESNIEHAFQAIRASVIKTAYASYWSELVNLWIEPGQPNGEIFKLLAYALEELDQDAKPESLINLLFLFRFIGNEGFQPILGHCTSCQCLIDDIHQPRLCFDLKQGGIVCRQCPSGSHTAIELSKGTLKQLQWMISQAPAVAERIKFSPLAISEATQFLDAFVPFHIGKTPKSLKFLKQVRPAI